MERLRGGSAKCRIGGTLQGQQGLEVVDGPGPGKIGEDKVHGVLAADPFCGYAFVFRNKRGDRLKLLLWDGLGFWLLYRHLDSSQQEKVSAVPCVDMRFRCGRPWSFTPNARSYIGVSKALGRTTVVRRQLRAQPDHGSHLASLVFRPVCLALRAGSAGTRYGGAFIPDDKQSVLEYPLGTPTNSWTVPRRETPDAQDVTSQIEIIYFIMQ
ncbi:MAG: IS66 family insertion sequence element accessory protein TnpB [Gammaproteobacteria bacterium]|nr:IS66 family insertion sequence element accessory protein TnpB [Gammaproteobacteria bacterium]